MVDWLVAMVTMAMVTDPMEPWGCMGITTSTLPSSGRLRWASCRVFLYPIRA